MDLEIVTKSTLDCKEKQSVVDQWQVEINIFWADDVRDDKLKTNTMFGITEQNKRKGRKEKEDSR